MMVRLEGQREGVPDTGFAKKVRWRWRSALPALPALLKKRLNCSAACSGGVPVLFSCTRTSGRAQAEAGGSQRPFDEAWLPDRLQALAGMQSRGAGRGAWLHDLISMAAMY